MSTTNWNIDECMAQSAIGILTNLIQIFQDDHNSHTPTINFYIGYAHPDSSQSQCQQAQQPNSTSLSSTCQNSATTDNNNQNYYYQQSGISDHDHYANQISMACNTNNQSDDYDPHSNVYIANLPRYDMTIHIPPMSDHIISNYSVYIYI